MTVAPDTAKSLDQQGSRYAAGADVLYTCPMHPQVRNIGPGTCPICGMALEPLIATLDQERAELDDMTRRFGIGVVLTLPLVLLGMSDMLPALNLQRWLSAATANWLQAVLATPVVWGAGWPLLVRAWHSFRTWQLNMFSLIGLGTGVAWLFSAVSLLFPALLPQTFKTQGAPPLYFESAAMITTLVLLGQTIVLDKTGTLTEGQPRVKRVVAATGFQSADVLAYGAALERASEHPLARAILEHAAAQAVPDLKVNRFESVTGQGAYAGFVDVADPVKPHAQQAVAQLKAQGLRIVLLTGDNAAAAAAVARFTGIDEVQAGVLPQDKYRRVQALQQQGRVVAMAGDGINDAPALAQAQVGIAMGSGTDIAMNSARIVLVKGDLRGILRARRLSRRTMRNIRQNLFFAFIYNFIGVPVAAGVLYPAFGLLLNPMIASAAMAASSVSVIANALRLRALDGERG